MITYTSHPVSQTFRHAEGAIWCPHRNNFLFVDILDGKIGRFDPDTGEISLIPTGSYTGTVVTDSEGGLVAALQDKIVRMDHTGKHCTELAKLESGDDIRSNDGKCDPAGRLWVGTMAMDARPHAGSLYCFDGTTVHQMIAGTTISNGICWSEDTRLMYYIDTADQCVKAYDFDIITGKITCPRIVISIPENDGSPDGMCIDAEGMLWVALWGGGCVKRYNPLCAEVLATVKVDAPFVSSCALGGKDKRQLLITTSRDNMNEASIKHYPLSGALFTAHVDAHMGETYNFDMKRLKRQNH